MEWGIGDVAREAGLQPSAIRYYERVGLLAPPPRAHGRRRYDDRVLKQLKVIDVAQAAGFTIAEIKTLLHGFDAGTPAAVRWRVLAQEKLPQVDALLARAQEMKRIIEDSLQCGCLTLEECAVSLRPSAEGPIPAHTNRRR
jgi:MerR family transcriptional regulator, redox-sensitive transcriptional activator SoxR